MRVAVAAAVVVAMSTNAAAAQERDWLAIGLESAHHAFSFSGWTDAVNKCGTLDGEVVETFLACLAVAYLNEAASGRRVWTWTEVATDADANGGAEDACTDTGGLASAVVNTYCLDGGSTAARQAPPTATAEQETVFWQSIMNSTNPAVFEAHLAQFPNGVFRALAETWLAQLGAPAGNFPAPAGRPAGGIAAPATGATAATNARPRPSEVFRDCDDCPEMVVIPAGSFRMGCVSGRECRDSQHPVHGVTIARPFALSRYEVTFGEYDRFAAATGRSRPNDHGWGRGRRPVVNVSWNDAQAYVSWLSSKTGARYRLPSEAEWEYAARAGTTTAYSWGNEVGNNRANCDGCGSQWDDEMTAPVGSFGANVWGLHDMHGNVWEWVEDCWHDSYAGAPSDGSAWTVRGNCGRRMVRGGAWGYVPRRLRAAARGSDATGVRDCNYIGFRVARTLD